MSNHSIRGHFHWALLFVLATALIFPANSAAQNWALNQCIIPSSPSMHALPPGAKHVTIEVEVPNSITVGNDFHFAINGTPFMPHGWSLTRENVKLHGETTTSEQFGALLDKLRDDGVNIITGGENMVIDYTHSCHPFEESGVYCDYTSFGAFGNTLCDFLNQAYDRGIYVIVWLSLRDVLHNDNLPRRYFEQDPNQQISRFERLTHIVETYANHPAVFGWNLAEELETVLEDNANSQGYRSYLGTETPAQWLEQAADAVRQGEINAFDGQNPNSHPIMYTVNLNTFLLQGGWEATDDTWDGLMWDTYHFGDMKRLDFKPWDDIASRYLETVRFGPEQARNIQAQPNGAAKASIFMGQGTDIDNGYVSEDDHYFATISGIIAGNRGNILWMLGDKVTTCDLYGYHSKIGKMMQHPDVNEDGHDLANVIMLGENRKNLTNANTGNNPDDISSFTLNGQQQFPINGNSNAPTIDLNYYNYTWPNFNEGTLPRGGGNNAENTGRLFVSEYTPNGAPLWTVSTMNFPGQNPDNFIGPARDIAISEHTDGDGPTLRRVYAATMGNAGLIYSEDNGQTYTRTNVFEAHANGWHNNNDVIAVEANGLDVIASKIFNRFNYRIDGGPQSWNVIQPLDDDRAFNAACFAFGSTDVNGNQTVLSGHAIEATKAASIQILGENDNGDPTFFSETANEDFVRLGANFRSSAVFDIEMDMVDGITYLAAGDGGIFARKSLTGNFPDPVPDPDPNTDPDVDPWTQIGNVSCRPSPDNGMELLETVWRLQLKPAFTVNGQVQPKRLFAATYHGLYYTENPTDLNGNINDATNISWTKIADNQIPHASVWDLAYDSNNNRLYASTGDGVYYSDNGGTGWARLTGLTTLADNNVNTEYYAIEVDSESRVYVGVDENKNSYYAPRQAMVNGLNVTPAPNEHEIFRDEAPLFDYIVRKHEGTYYIFAANYFKPEVNVRFNFGSILENNETIYRATEILPDGTTQHLPLHQASVNDNGRVLDDPSSFEFNADFGSYQARVFKFEVFAWDDTQRFLAMVDGEIQGAGVELAKIGKGSANGDPLAGDTRLDLVLMAVTKGPVNQTMNFEVAWDMTKMSDHVANWTGPQFGTDYDNNYDNNITNGSAAFTGVFGSTLGGGIHADDFDNNGQIDFLMMSIQDPTDRVQDGMDYEYQIAWNVTGNELDVNYTANTSETFIMPYPWQGMAPTGGGIAAYDLSYPTPSQATAALYLMREEARFFGDDPFSINRSDLTFTGQSLNNSPALCGQGMILDGVDWTTSGAGMDIADIEGDGVYDAILMGIQPTQEEARLYFKELDTDPTVNCNITSAWAPYIRIPMCVENDLIYGGVATGDIDCDGDQDIVVMTTIKNQSGYDEFCVRFGINGAISQDNDPFSNHGPCIPSSKGSLNDDARPGPRNTNPHNIASFSTQNSPNPFSETTTIHVDVKQTAPVQIDLLNILGVQVATINSGQLNYGQHSFNVSAAELPAGHYICRMSIDGVKSDTMVITVVK